MINREKRQPRERGNGKSCSCATAVQNAGATDGAQFVRRLADFLRADVMVRPPPQPAHIHRVAVKSMDVGFDRREGTVGRAVPTMILGVSIGEGKDGAATVENSRDMIPNRIGVLQRNDKLGNADTHGFNVDENESGRRLE